MSQSATSVTATGTTGSVCQASGPYKCNSHTTTILFVKKGDKFPACPNASSTRGHSASWTMVRD